MSKLLDRLSAWMKGESMSEPEKPPETEIPISEPAFDPIAAEHKSDDLLRQSAGYYGPIEHTAVAPEKPKRLRTKPKPKPHHRKRK